jgi:hypothetical protein
MQESAQTNPCPQCSQQNTADSKYCANCNLHINGVCPRCATHNLHSTHFCSSCGLDFAPATSHGLARSTGLPVDMPVRTRTKPGGVIRRAVAYTLDMLIAPAAAILPYFVIPDVRYYEVNITSSWNVFWAFAFFYPPVALTLWSTTF